MGLLNAVFKKKVPCPKILNVDNYLFVGPHPDDIEVACGGTVAKLAAMGKKITFLICTDGRYGNLEKKINCNEYAGTRKQEAINSAAVLGVNDVRFLELHDGGMYSIEQAAKLISLTIAEVKPDIVFIPDHTLETECHPDHLKIGQAAYNSLIYTQIPQQLSDWGCEFGRANVFACAMYYTAKPNSYVNVTKYMNLRKIAISKHTSQFNEQQLNTLMTYSNIRGFRMGLRCGAKRAEAFKLIGITFTHCLTELAE